MVWPAVLGCGTDVRDTQEGTPDPNTIGSETSTTVPEFSCEGVAFTISKNELSPKMPTVGLVEWTVRGGTPTSAKIAYTLKDASKSTLNVGGEAPVVLERTNHRTLLLGLKQGRDYVFNVEATFGDVACQSGELALPTTGQLVDPPIIAVEIVDPKQRHDGFIVSSSGQPDSNRGYIVDADGDVVWSAPGPEDTTRAKMDYEGDHMWMLALNLNNKVGEMRAVSMDGALTRYDVPGLERAHHDFTVMPGGRVAAITWLGTTPNEESTLIIRSPDGTLENPFKIGANLYKSSSYHANAIHFVPFDGSFTISDRSPNSIVKVSSTGKPEWQIGGDCTDAPTKDRCWPQTWQVNHGHQLFEDGTFVLFNNTYTAASHVFEFRVDNAVAPTLVKDFTGDRWTATLGDVQRLPNGNTLVTYSSARSVVELDSNWQVVQIFSGPFAYSDWRPTLYGPPPRP
jgi:hypothetical protein